MKRYLLLAALAVGILIGACIHNIPSMPTGVPGVIVLEAQSLPLTKVYAWDETSTDVLNYTVTLDGVVVGSPTVKQQSVTFTALGPHTITVTATNVWGTSGPLTQSVNVQPPSAPSNGRFQ